MTDSTDESFQTVAAPGEATLRRQGSRFRARIEPTSTVEAAEGFHERVRQSHPDATHVVPAYRVRVDGGAFLREYSSDDGEPRGSAGPPALNVLEGQSLENVVVCFVRHYGGTNLGVGGLVSAYGESVKRAIRDAGTTTARPIARFDVTASYDDSGTVRSVLESAPADFNASYEEQVSFTVEIPRREADGLRERLRSATSDRVSIDLLDG